MDSRADWRSKNLVVELAEAALAIAPAEDNPESAVGKKDRLCCRQVHLQSTRRFDSLEKEVCVSLRSKGMDLNVRLDLVRVESVKIWQLLERVLTVSVGIKFSAHGMVLDDRSTWNQSSHRRAPVVRPVRS